MFLSQTVELTIFATQHKKTFSRMKKNAAILLFFLLATTLLPLSAQTLYVHTGSVATAFTATPDDMPFTDGATLTIGGMAFSISEIDSICVKDDTFDDNAVRVTYDGTSARVVVSGTAAPYLSVNVSGAHVAIAQSADLADELTYTLQGTSTDGSFWMDGKLKASLVLNGLTLTCADSAAINIRNGKRISVQLADGTTNTLTDASGGSHKGCFMVKGHTEFKGSGTLTLTGRTGHAFWGGEYVEVKKSVGTITVASAVTDGFNVNQYFEQKGGTVIVRGVGDDGIQVSKTDDETDEQNGRAIISGGTLTVAVTAAAAKGLKVEDTTTITGGTVTITTSGTGAYDSSDQDVSASACIKGDGAITISGGTLSLKSTGAGGKGINCDASVTIAGGTIDVTTTGKQYTYNRLSASPKGIRAEGNLIISDGTLTVTCSGGEGSEGLESKDSIIVTGGDIISTCYDDALNAANHIDISGGRIYAYGSNNDGVDSNGTLRISGGLVLANGTSAPEEGFDCDQNTFTVTGGTLIGIGGSTSTPTTSTTTQPVMILSGCSLTQGSYLTLTASDGTLLLSYALPRTLSGATLLVSCPSLSTGNAYTLTTGATVTASSSWQGYSADATASGGTSLASLTLTSVVTTSGSSGGGNNPGGGGGGPGGGGGGPGGGGGGRF